MDDVVFGIINVQLFACGLLGGLVHSFSLEKATPWQVIGHIVTGGFAANFFAPIAVAGASNFMSPQVLKIVPAATIGMAIAFGFGLTGRHACLVLEKMLNSWNPFGKAKNE